MKMFLLGLCSTLLLLPAVHASTVYSTSVSQNLDVDATAIYRVVAGSQGIDSYGFTSATTWSDSTLQLALNYGPLAGTTITSATLDLSRLFTSAGLTSSRSLSYQTNGGHKVGNEPAFSSTPAGVFVTITGALSGSQTLNPGGMTGYNLVPYFLQDLQAGNSLTVHVTLTDSFTATTPSGTWKNEEATYHLSQRLTGTFSAATTVVYSPISRPSDPRVPPTPTPEPLTMLLSGGGLVGLGALRRKRKS